MTKPHRIFCILLLTSCPAVAQPNPPEIDDVLDNMVRAYGGEENLIKLNTMTQEWDMVALRSSRHGKDLRSVRIPGQLRVELVYPDRTEVRILNGAASHVIFGDSPARAASEAQRDAMRLQLMRLYSPLQLRERRDLLQFTVSGKYGALTLVEDGLRADYLVDMDHWRIEKVAGTLTVNGMEMRFLTEYSDFAFQDGVLIHRRENKFAGDVNTAVLQLRRLVPAAELDPERFEPQ